MTSPLFVDSATFKKIDIDQLFAHDPEVRDSYERGDSIGATGLTVASFLYDLHVADSALFTTISAPTIDTTSLDSAIFDNIMLDSGASMIIDTIDYDSSEKVTIHNLRIDQVDNMDSAHFRYISATNVTSNDARIDKATIDSAAINNSITIDNQEFDGLTVFEITDASNTPYWAAYKLDSV